MKTSTNTSSIVIPNTSLFFSLFCIMFFVTFSYTLTLIASPYIAGDLGASNDIASYSLTFYGLGNALGIPLGKILLGHFRKVHILVSCLLLIAFFSWTAAIAPNYPLFIINRILQGFVMGPFFPVIFTLFSILAPREKKDAFISVFLTIFTVVPVVGACWGGWIAYDFNWRWMFYFNIPFFLVLAWYVWIRLKDYESKINKTPIDGIGYLFYLIGISSIVTLVITGQQLDWFRSPLLIGLFVSGIVSGIFFILWELHHENPLIDFRLLKNFVFSFALFNLGILFSAYFGMVMLLALWLTLTVNYTPEWIGLLIGTMALAGLLPKYLILKGFHRIDCRIPLTIAIIFFAVSSFHTMYFNEEINFGRIAFSRTIAGFGLAFFLPPLFRLCFRTFPEKNALDIVGLFQVGRLLSTSLGAAIYTTIWQRRQAFYHERLGSKLTAFSMQTRDFFSQAKEFHLRGNPAHAELNELLDRQAIALALDDCFYLMGWVMVGLLILILLTYLFRRQGFIPETNRDALENDQGQ